MRPPLDSTRSAATDPEREARIPGMLPEVRKAPRRPGLVRAGVAALAAAALLHFWVFPAVAHDERFELGEVTRVLRSHYGWPASGFV
ncbi:MAG: hypothetical protein HMLKMBBP_03530 [Planctomycetes bacterium]|nr:hypothetical protein [Planctomycetota bacterium]